jgi:hypothetical protein
MTRKTFWTSLFVFGVARAQQSEPAWRSGSALNNQCPQCGSMADPYRPHDAGHLIDCSHPKPGQVCVAPVRAVQPSFRVTRCQRCNDAFFQDTE